MAKRRILKKKNTRFIKAFNKLQQNPKSKSLKKKFLAALKSHNQQLK